MVIVVIGVIFFAWYGLSTIGTYGETFIQYLVQYVLTNVLFYMAVLAVIAINMLLFWRDAPVIDIAFLEAIISFIVYIVWGCKAYSASGAWETMSGLMLPIAAFFGIMWMSLFFSIVSAAVCVGTAVLLYIAADSIEKSAPKAKTAKKASKQTVRDYLQSHTDEYGIMHGNYGDTWKCSFCGEWVSMYSLYCDKCTQKRLGDDMVKHFDPHKKKNFH